MTSSFLRCGVGLGLAVVIGCSANVVFDGDDGQSGGTGNAGGGSQPGPCTAFADHLGGFVLVSIALPLSPERPVFMWAQAIPGDATQWWFAGAFLHPDDTTLVVGGDFQVPVVSQDDGSYVIDFGTITVPAEANPFAPTPIVTTLKLNGAPLCTLGDAICGTVSGIVSQPLPDFDLTGGTFGMTPFPNLAVPVSPVTDCDGNF